MEEVVLARDVVVVFSIYIANKIKTGRVQYKEEKAE